MGGSKITFGHELILDWHTLSGIALIDDDDQSIARRLQKQVREVWLQQVFKGINTSGLGTLSEQIAQRYWLAMVEVSAAAQCAFLSFGVGRQVIP